MIFLAIPATVSVNEVLYMMNVVSLDSIQVIAERKPPRIKRQNTFTIDGGGGGGESGGEKRAKTDMDGARGARRAQHASQGRRGGGAAAAAAKPQSSLTTTTPRTRNGVLGDRMTLVENHTPARDIQDLGAPRAKS